MKFNFLKIYLEETETPHHRKKTENATRTDIPPFWIVDFFL